MSLISEPYENSDYIDGLKAAIQNDRTISGFSAVSNVITTLTFDATNTTSDELAHALGTLINYLISEKIVG